MNLNIKIFSSIKLNKNLSRLILNYITYTPDSLQKLTLLNCNKNFCDELNDQFESFKNIETFDLMLLAVSYGYNCIIMPSSIFWNNRYYDDIINKYQNIITYFIPEKGINYKIVLKNINLLEEKKIDYMILFNIYRKNNEKNLI